MNPQNAPRVGQKIADVVSEGAGSIAKMSLWLQQCLRLLGRNPDSTLFNQPVGASPYTYTNTSDFDQMLVIDGGTVLSIRYVRDGIMTLVASATPFNIVVTPGDGLWINYAAPPFITVIPR